MSSSRRMYSPVPFTAVRIADRFWSPRLRTNRSRTIPAAYRQCATTGRIAAFRLDWKPGQPNEPHIFWDSDVAKWIEAAAYSLATHPDPALDRQLDAVIKLVAGAQQPDGYLNTHFTVVEPAKRWTNLRDLHELYCAGHLLEAAVAHFQATGKRALLDVACRFADHIGATFGRGRGRKRGYCGHPEIELALVKLHRATGQRRYLELARYFVDERGRRPHFYDREARARGDDPKQFWAKTYAYCQALVPVRQLHRVVGHAVRAMYLLSAMADLAGDGGDAGLRAACRRVWDNLVQRNLYLTGGLGPSRHNEGFTADYELPNETAYCETCAAIALVFWAHRLLQLANDGQYADVLERALYNGVLSGVSLEGTKFFYENPLASRGQHHRQDWFGCACCPPNLARLLASLGGYVYGQGERDAVVHLYVGGSAQLSVSGQAVRLEQRTAYPWAGQVDITVRPSQPARFGLRLRVPGWCRRARLWVNGKRAPVRLTRGYARLERRWQAGDRVHLELSMPVERVYTHPRVHANAGRVALQRGPIVYCLEQADNGANLDTLALPVRAKLQTHWRPNPLGGVVTITGQAKRLSGQGWHGRLYDTRPPRAGTVRFTAVPYSVWDNRSPGEMQVWLREG